MNFNGIVLRCGAVALAAWLAGCANRPPIILSSQYVPPGMSGATPSSTFKGRICRIRLGEVLDRRADPLSMGEIAGRPVRAADAAAWLRSGLQSLAQDGRLTLVAGEADLTLNADLLKGYVMSVTTTKSAEIVVHIRYETPGAGPVEQVYRGSDDSLDWVGGNGESQSALNRALAQALAAVQNDILARCAAGH